MNAADLREYTRTLEELDRRKRENALAYYAPYLKQRQFHDHGADKRERMLAAGNQLGKTYCGAAEMAMHVTGQYPGWWAGKRFDGGIVAWCSGVTSEATRDTVQRLLLGPPGSDDSGLVPKASIIETSMGRGVNGCVDTVTIRHVTGATSILQFKAFEKGREKWQGASVHAVWLDEECDHEIYSEALARIAARSGIIYTTFTPLLGMSGVVNRFFGEAHPDRALVQMGIEDAEHIPVAERERIAQGYQEFERDARLRGIPMLGSGRIFPLAESVISTPAFKIPDHWARIAAVDFGWDHPTTCAWLAWDRDSDVVYLTDVYKARQATIAVHAAAIKAKGDVVTAWPHDGMQADRTSGDSIAQLYRKAGVRMLPERATFPDGGNSVEAGIADMLDRMQCGQFKVFEHLHDFWTEFRTYHRKDGRVVKESDDVISAVRYGLMSLRHARTSDHYSRPRVQVASGMHDDLFDRDASPSNSGAVGVSWGDPRARRDQQRREAGAARECDSLLFLD